MTEAEFEELLSIVDEAAGREHSRIGRVAATLHKVLARYDEMRTGRPCESMVAARALLGREVVVTLQREQVMTGGGPDRVLPVEVGGRLAAVSESGEVTLIDADGFARYGWPMLDIREA